MLFGDRPGLLILISIAVPARAVPAFSGEIQSPCTIYGLLGYNRAFALQYLLGGKIKDRMEKG